MVREKPSRPLVLLQRRRSLMSLTVAFLFLSKTSFFVVVARSPLPGSTSVITYRRNHPGSRCCQPVTTMKVRHVPTHPCSDRHPTKEDDDVLGHQLIRLLKAVSTNSHTTTTINNRLKCVGKRLLFEEAAAAAAAAGNPLSRLECQQLLFSLSLFHNPLQTESLTRARAHTLESVPISRAKCIGGALPPPPLLPLPSPANVE